MSDLLISIDPAGSKSDQFCWWIDGRLTSITTEAVCVDDWRIVIEDQFGKHRGDNLLKLAKHAGWLIGRMGRDLDEVEWSQPSVWKPRLCKRSSPKVKKCDDYFVHKAILKTLAPDELPIYWFAINATNNQGTKMDIADAVGIGLVALGRIGAVL
jgi:hypothetical protein